MVDQSQGRKTIRVAISGYYGFNNSGDEAVLKSILNALADEGAKQGVNVQPVVLSADPAGTTGMYGVEAVHRMRPADLLGALRSCDGLISGGGSLLQDATSAKTIPYYTGVLKLAQLLGKPTYIYSQGIGPVNRRWMDPLVRGVMNKSRYISVRDAESAALLARIGVKPGRVVVVPDPVMGLPLPAGAAAAGAASAEGAPIVGVSLRRWRKDGADLARAAEALAALARRRPVRLCFLPFHMPGDAEASRAVMERLGDIGPSTAELLAPGDDPQQMLLAVDRCAIVFGMRLHALIYAANRRVPMLGLSYDPKIDQFLARLDLEPIGTTEALAAEAFADAAEALLADGGRAAWQAKHGGAIELLREASQLPAQHIVTDLRLNHTR